MLDHQLPCLFSAKTFFYTPAIQDSGAPLQKVSHNATVGVECHQKNWDLGEDYSYAIPGNLSEMHPQSTNRLTCISQLWPDKTMPVRSCRRLWPKWRNVLMPFFLHSRKTFCFCESRSQLLKDMFQYDCLRYSR